MRHQFERLVQSAAAGDLGQLRHVVELRRPLREPGIVQALVSGPDADGRRLLLELSEIEQQLRVSREDHQLGLSEANRVLLRNLAHEIKNPLGGIRGAAQLLQKREVSLFSHAHRGHLIAPSPFLLLGERQHRTGGRSTAC